MVFQLHMPAYPLNQFVESFIYYRDYNPVHSVDRFLPDGNVNIVIDLTDYPKYIYDNETLKEIQACRDVWFSGMRNKYISIPSGRDSEMFIINFHKGRSYPFVQMPLYELTDSVVDGELVLTNEIMDMREMILEMPSISQKFLTAENFLLKKFHTKLVVNPFIEFAVNRIVEAPSQLTIEQISHKVGYSQKHLIKLFKDNVGLTPKGFLKVIRFQKAIQEIDASKNISWAGLALESGYYDQAHFINDFKLFSGFTPQEYLQKQSEYLNYIAVG
ncbi:MAG: helix-turn-helix transcriptional regulator [Ferruginibacter sp.]|nr:helix-turn-helix transcriptional regulator [Ferruginibacter sp.]